MPKTFSVWWSPNKDECHYIDSMIGRHNDNEQMAKDRFIRSMLVVASDFFKPHLKAMLEANIVVSEMPK